MHALFIISVVYVYLQVFKINNNYKNLEKHNTIRTRM